MAGIFVSMDARGAHRVLGSRPSVGVAALVAAGLLGACAHVRPPSDGSPAAITPVASSTAAGASTSPAQPAASSANTAAPPVATPSAAPSSAPVATSSAPPPTAPSAAPSASAAPAAPELFPATASISDPSFEGGDVPKAKTSVDKLKKKIEKCVNAGGGVQKKGASIKLQFLVRAQGIAEGVDVLDAKDIGEKAGKCVRDAFKKKQIGAPSADPVGVTITIDFAPSGST